MKHRLAALFVVLLLPSAAPAQASEPTQPFTPSGLSPDTRIAILENRMDRVEQSIYDLRLMPSQLSRIEEQIRQLTERSSGNSGVLQTVASAIMGVFIGGIGACIWRNPREK